MGAAGVFLSGTGRKQVFPAGGRLCLRRGCGDLFRPGADRGLFVPAGGRIFLLLLFSLSPGAGRGPGPFSHTFSSPWVSLPIFPRRRPGVCFSLRGHTFSPAAERKYQRDAAREGLFTETPLSGLSLLRGESQLLSYVLDLCSLLSFCCRSAADDVTRTRLRCPGRLLPLCRGLPFSRRAWRRLSFPAQMAGRSGPAGGILSLQQRRESIKETPPERGFLQRRPSLDSPS